VGDVEACLIPRAGFEPSADRKRRLPRGGRDLPRRHDWMESEGERQAAGDEREAGCEKQEAHVAACMRPPCAIHLKADTTGKWRRRYRLREWLQRALEPL